jgi:hypothetical protein
VSRTKTCVLSKYRLVNIFTLNSLTLFSSSLLTASTGPDQARAPFGPSMCLYNLVIFFPYSAEDGDSKSVRNVDIAICYHSMDNPKDTFNFGRLDCLKTVLSVRSTRECKCVEKSISPLPLPTPHPLAACPCVIYRTRSVRPLYMVHCLVYSKPTVN